MVKIRLFCCFLLHLLYSNPQYSFIFARSFYRFVLEPELASGTKREFPLPPGASFLEMPDYPLLTLNMNTPESWLVEAVSSSYDLDNIHLKDVSRETAQILRKHVTSPFLISTSLGYLNIFIMQHWYASQKADNIWLNVHKNVHSYVRTINGSRAKYQISFMFGTTLMRHIPNAFI